MSLDAFATCRMCGECEPESRLVRYGPRHCAHPRCFLKKKGVVGLRSLRDWQLERFPALVAQEFGLLDELRKLIQVAGDESRRERRP